MERNKIVRLLDAFKQLKQNYILGRKIKTIKTAKYEHAMFFEIYPLFYGITDGAKMRLEQKFKESVIKEAKYDFIFDDLINDEQKERLGQRIYFVSKEVAIASALNATGQMALPYTMAQINKDILEVIQNRIFKITTTQITDTLAEQIKGKIKTGFDKGLTVKQIADSLTELKTNASLIARQEVSNVAQESHFISMEKASEALNVEIEKTWVHSGNPKEPREEHIAMGHAKETVKLNERFSNGLKYPHDPDGSAEEVINCGCDVAYNVVRRAA